MNDLPEGNGERFRGSLGPKVTGQAGRVLREGYLQKATWDLKVALSQRADLLAKTHADANLVDGPVDAWDDNDARVEFAMSEIATCPVLSLAVLKIKLHCYEELRAAYGQEDRRVIQIVGHPKPAVPVSASLDHSALRPSRSFSHSRWLPEADVFHRSQNA
jgi:hypothetical protein